MRQWAASALRKIDTEAARAGLLDAAKLYSSGEKQQLTSPTTIVVNPQPYQFPRISIASRSGATERILSQTTEPSIQHIISIGEPGTEPPEGYTLVSNRLRLEFDDIITPFEDPEYVLVGCPSSFE